MISRLGLCFGGSLLIGLAMSSTPTFQFNCGMKITSDDFLALSLIIKTGVRPIITMTILVATKFAPVFCAQ